MPGISPLAIIVEGRDDVKILKAVLSRAGLSGSIPVHPVEGEPGGIDNLPHLVKSHLETVRCFLVLFDPDDQSPERRAEDIFHKIWESMNKEGFDRDEKKDWHEGYLSLYWFSKGEDRRIVAIFPVWLPPDQLAPVAPFLQRPFRHSILDKILIAGLRDEALAACVGDNHRDRMRRKLEEVLEVLRRQGIYIPSSKHALNLYAALAHIIGGKWYPLGALGERIIQAMDEGDFQKMFGVLIGLIQRLYLIARSGG